MKKVLFIPLLIILLGCISCSNDGYFTKIPSTPSETPEPTVVPTAAPRSGVGGSGYFGGELPTTPQNLRIGQYNSNYIYLAWNDSLYTSTYELYRDDILIDGSIPAGEPYYLDTGLSMDTQYCYQVAASNVSGDSAKSNEACATTLHCLNATGPVLTIESAGISSNYPSVSEGSEFTKTNTVSLNYAISDTDGCDSGFGVNIYLYKDGSLVQSWLGLSKTAGGQSESYTIPVYTASPEGTYSLRVFATDNDVNTSDDEKTEDNYFTIGTLPIADNSGAPSVVFTSGDITVCPNEYFTLTFTLTDDSLTSGGLSDDWLHTYIYRKVSTLRDNEYDDVISDGERYPRQSSPVPMGTYWEYYSDAYDFQLNSVADADNTNVIRVDITRDTAAPTGLSFSSLPASTDLEAGESYGISVNEPADNCSAGGFWYDYYFVYNGGAQRVTIASDTTSRTRSYTPGAGLIGQTGYFEVTVSDSSGNEMTITSPNYDIVQNMRPTVTLSIDPSPSYFDIGDTTDISVDIDSLDLTDAVITSLTCSPSCGSILSGQNYSSDPYTVSAWSVPPSGGSYTLTVNVSNNGYTDSDSLNFQVGQGPSLDLSTTPSSPFTPEQAIEINLGVIDNDMTGMQINSVTYTQDGSNFNTIAENVTYAGNETISWTTPIFPGSYEIHAEIEDSEGYNQTDSLGIQVNPSDSSRTVVYLDYDLSGSALFSESAQFDINADGIKEWTRWLNSQDGYLVSSNAVNNINDFAFLGDMIGSAGSILDSADSLYGTVKLWVDENSNAISDSGEVKSLSEAGITRIELDPCCTFWLE